MPFTFICIPCSSNSSSFPFDDPSLPATSASDNSATSSSDTSATSSSTTLTSASSITSIQTFPSLPTLHSNFVLSQNTPTPISASFSLLSSLNSNNPQLSHNSHSAPALAISSNFLFSFSNSLTAVYDLTSLRQIISFPSSASNGAVKFAVISPSNRLFTAHQDGKIRTWTQSPLKLRLLTTLPTLTDRLRRLPLPSNYVTIRRHHKRLWIEHADAVSAVAISNNLLYSVSWDRTLKIWRLSDLRCLESLKAHDDAVNAVAVGPDGTVYTGSADRRIRVWGRDGNRHVLVATLERHKSAVNAVAVSGDGHVLYSGACDRSILVWEREESANFMVCTGALRGHGKAILCLSTVGMSLVVSGSNDRTVRIWRRGGMGEGYSCLCVMMGHVRGVRSVVVEREGSDSEEGECYRVCSGSFDGDVRVWSLRVKIGNEPGSDKQ